jgi:transposase
VVFARGVAKFRDGLRAWLADSENGLSGSALETFRELKSQLDDKEERLHEYERRLTQAAKAEMAQKLMEVPGVGPITATAVMASVADARHFRSGRDFAANLGLVPREHSSGGKQRLYGITNKGDTQLRTLIIHERAAQYALLATSRSGCCAGPARWPSSAPLMWRRSRWPTRWPG